MKRVNTDLVHDLAKMSEICPETPFYIDDIENNRTVGKSFRTILISLLQASDGERVLFVCKSYPMINITYGLMSNILKNFNITIDFRDKHVIEFPNKGKLILTTPDAFERAARGRKIDAVFYDY